MPDDTFFTHDVLIAGAGPTGLALACELQLAGRSVLVLERAPNPYAPTKAMPFGLRGLTVPTIEHFDRRGLLGALGHGAEVRNTAGSTAPEQRERRAGGHFAGIDFFYDEVDATWLHRIPASSQSLAAEMATIEAVLAERATSLGATIRRGVGVDAVKQDDEHVVVIASGERFRARYVVGCDGGRSAVRKAAGFDFVGTAPEFTGYSVEVTLDDAGMLQPGRNLAPGGIYIYAPPGTIWMADFDGGTAHRTVLLDREHVEAVLRRVSGQAVTVDAVHQATSWTDRAALATEYRRGRVLLAGDAAHIHSPLGGQGLNLGLGDAMNLGWKLASVLRGDAPPDLLDTYARERRPVAVQILERSRAQVALLRPDPGSRALEAIMTDLIGTADGNRYFAERVSAAELRYDLGDPHPLVGRSVPNFSCMDGIKANEHLRDGRGLLLEFGSGAALREVTDAWVDRVTYARCDAAARPELRAILVRPDGIVAWVQEDASDTAPLIQACNRWFGVGSGRASRSDAAALATSGDRATLVP